ncbi:MAG: AraC family transcriptional regulator [Planctomycetes bacterium]|nr:AraC family transcriptional regulator [Planctomycetota bacterium]
MTPKPVPGRLNLPANGKRLIYDLSRFGLPEIPYLAAQNLPFTTAGLPFHTHKERMEINLIIKGERVYHVDGTDYHLRGNDVFITWPWEMHGSGSYLHGRGVHFWMQVIIPPTGNAFLGLDAERAAPLLDALWSMPRRRFKADQAMRDVYGRVLTLCHNGPSPLATVELSALLIQWFLLLADSSRRETKETVTADIARALDLMTRTDHRHLRIEDLAEAACLSESRFKGKFREQLGVPPVEYLLRRRTEMAADLLAKNRKSLTEIALDLGFSSVQHFSATFKRFFGESPLVWLRKNREVDLMHAMLHSENGDPGDDELRPWIDAEGMVHGYVERSRHDGVHPNC